MFNLLKKYNSLLEVDMLSPAQRTKSLRGVFDRDIPNNPAFAFREKKITLYCNIRAKDAWLLGQTSFDFLPSNEG